jgi:transposase
LARGAQSFGYDTDLWTTERIADVLAKEWGVHYTNVGVWKILRAHGFSWQRPRRQATEKDLRAVANWKGRSWPRFKKKPDAKEP